MFEKHILNLADNNTPSQFIISDIFNKKFAPTNVSTNFLKPSAPHLEINSNEQNLIICFDEKNYLTYNLYCNFVLIKKNVHSNFILPKPNNNCFFYLVAKNPHTKQSKKSNYKVYIIKNPE